jgi:DNA-directed RNA polymerase subunit RPC12/RpoP
VRIIRSCSWCGIENEILSNDHPVYCHKCGHRTDTSRMTCDCVRCVAKIDDILKPLTLQEKDQS